MKIHLILLTTLAVYLTSCKDKKEPEPEEPVNEIRKPEYDEEGILKWPETDFLTTYYTLVDTVNYHPFFARIDTQRSDSSDIRAEFTINNVRFPHVAYQKSKYPNDSTWNFQFHIKLSRQFFSGPVIKWRQKYS